MTSARKALGVQLSALAAGLLFGLGLIVSGMAQPAKVRAFLDPLGAWDASLLFVMAAAVGVHQLSYRLVRRRAAPLYAADFAIPTRRDIDVRLLAGAVLFGVGWGMSGLCPGTGLAALANGSLEVTAFVGATLLGSYAMVRLDAVRFARSRPKSADVGHERPLST